MDEDFKRAKLNYEKDLKMGKKRLKHTHMSTSVKNLWRIKRAMDKKKGERG